MPTGFTQVAAGPTTYCVVSQNGNWYAWKKRPGGIVTVSALVSDVCTT